MRRTTHNILTRTLLLGVCAPLFISHVGAADEWLQWGGPKGDFTVDVEGLAEWWPERGPRTLWKRPLGAGYSSILYKDGRLYTMYRDEATETEVVIAPEATTGETKWKLSYPVEIWPDMTPAFGLGPNATPLIVGNRLIAISIDGVVRSLHLASGTLQWKHDLPAEYGRRKRDEEYGYSASPLVYDGKVIVLVGGDDHAVVAFDPADGSTVWKSDPGGVSYAPATLTTLGGRDQFIYFEPEGAVGLDPATGRTLWKHEMEYNNGNHLTPVVKCDDGHIWIGSQFPSGGGRLLEITPTSTDVWKAKRIWFETYLRASHWTNIRIGDHIYGSTGGNSTSLLTAFEWKTGKVAWRRRGFHKAQALYADGKLLFLDEDGKLALAKISPEGVEVLASAQVTESVSWSLPTLVGTTLYARDTNNIMALDLADTGKPRPARASGGDPVERPELLGEFGAFIHTLNTAENKKEQIDAYMGEQKAFPIVEGDALVHFVYRGDVPAVSVTGNFLMFGQVDPMYQVEGTDLYFRSYQLDPGAHYEYRFDVFEDRTPDPLNPRRVTPDGPLSVVTTAGWTEPAHLREPTGARGKIETFTWKSEHLDNEREISVYLPAGYDDAEDVRYPIVIVNYGNLALSDGLWSNSLDNLIGKTVAPLIAVFVPRVNFDEYGPGVVKFSNAITDELIPYVDEHYRTLATAESRAMTGIASGGFASAYTALDKPGTIGNVAMQSFYFRPEASEMLRSMAVGRDPSIARFYIEWSKNDLDDGNQLKCEEHSRALTRILTDEGFAVAENRVVDGAGWGSWRARTDRILITF
ncbi:MAG: PQQ-binding-like beta-propeller repeat protein, partial [Acidobacteriota bacterium]|nr:PQQ-binding-like beta-propeller repeat protein [Acidobacteriota bacterium]